jgi:hypothetical protein
MDDRAEGLNRAMGRVLNEAKRARLAADWLTSLRLGAASCECDRHLCRRSRAIPT